MPQAPKNLRDFASLVKIIELLRGPDGCPWDKEQTHLSLTRYAIEEAYELCEAIERDDSPAVQDELGDLLLQVVLHAEIARQEGRFDIADVIETLTTKMVRRHPHVFGDVKVKSSAEVLSNWHDIKEDEKKAKKKTKASSTRGPFSLPRALPALLYAQKIGEKTRKVRFDWKKVKDVVAKVDEEWRETRTAIRRGKTSEQMHEVGDLLFSVAQLARHLGFDAEQSLRTTNSRFEARFTKMQELARERGQDFSKLREPALEKLWQEAKKIEKNRKALFKSKLKF